MSYVTGEKGVWLLSNGDARACSFAFEVTAVCTDDIACISLSVSSRRVVIDAVHQSVVISRLAFHFQPLIRLLISRLSPPFLSLSACVQAEKMKLSRRGKSNKSEQTPSDLSR